MTNLMQVRRGGSLLLWPVSLQREEKVRGVAGYVVDMDAPLEAEWCAGQMHKLEPAAAGAAPGPILHPTALRLIKQEVERQARAAAEPKQDTPLESPSADAVSSDRDLEVHRPRTKKAVSA